MACRTGKTGVLKVFVFRQYSSKQSPHSIITHLGKPTRWVMPCSEESFKIIPKMTKNSELLACWMGFVPVFAVGYDRAISYKINDSS